MEHNVSERTTHVVCGTVRRTINVLAGTVKGCWILSMDWVKRRGRERRGEGGRERRGKGGREGEERGEGDWLFSLSFKVLKSLEADQWLPEGPFELITDFPSAQVRGRERENGRKERENERDGTEREWRDGTEREWRDGTERVIGLF